MTGGVEESGGAQEGWDRDAMGGAERQRRDHQVLYISAIGASRPAALLRYPQWYPETRLCRLVASCL